MQLARPAFAPHPSRFGRAQVRFAALASEPASTPTGDLRLFAGTFLAGFLFVSILIG